VYVILTWLRLTRTEWLLVNRELHYPGGAGAAPKLAGLSIDVLIGHLRLNQE